RTRIPMIMRPRPMRIDRTFAAVLAVGLVYAGPALAFDHLCGARCCGHAGGARVTTGAVVTTGAIVTGARVRTSFAGSFAGAAFVPGNLTLTNIPASGAFTFGPAAVNPMVTYYSPSVVTFAPTVNPPTFGPDTTSRDAALVQALQNLNQTLTNLNQTLTTTNTLLRARGTPAPAPGVRPPGTN